MLYLISLYASKCSYELAAQTKIDEEIQSLELKKKILSNSRLKCIEAKDKLYTALQEIVQHFENEGNH
eukprot:Pgem_evm1s2743